MGKEQKLELLNRRIEEEINNFQGKRRECKIKAIIIKVVEGILSLATMLFLGLKVDSANIPLMQNLALISSSTLVFILTIETFLNYKSFWIRYTANVISLKQLKDSLSFLLTEGIENVSEKDLDNIFDDLEELINATNEYWVQIRKDKSATSSKK
ncbi:MAG: SLATT domain-containing protein [Planctomycetes bacterium]|nr:SLATT domain-containing protein [Planctomycetota bacterium]